MFYLFFSGHKRYQICIPIFVYLIEIKTPLDSTENTFEIHLFCAIQIHLHIYMINKKILYNCTFGKLLNVC